MNVTDNNRIQETYEEMTESMALLVRSHEDAVSILCSDIYGWMEPEHSAWKADLCGILTEKITGRNIGERVHTLARNNTPYYQEIQRRYAFGKSVGELGEYWQELIREEKPFRLRLLLGWLKAYYTVIIPYAKNEMVAWFSEAGQDYPELAPALKPYQKHRAKIKATMQIIETALDIWSLQGKSDQEEN